MIVRVWRGLAQSGKSGVYRDHLERRVFPALAALPGHRGAFLLARDAQEGAEVVAVTLWDSMEAIEAFAGDRPDRAVIEPEARALMVSFDEVVAHYELELAMNVEPTLLAGR